MKKVTFEVRDEVDWATVVHDNDDTVSDVVERLKGTDMWSSIEEPYKSWIAAKRPSPAKLAAEEAAKKAEEAAAAAAADKKAKDAAAAAAKKAEEPKHPSARNDKK